MPRMPALFIGHGNPMNALEDNVYTRVWAQLSSRFPRPKAILAVSAHWMTQGVAVTAMAAPKTIHDFGGFPPALYEVQYPAQGDPALAQRVAAVLAPLGVSLDHDWGLDHGSWSVLCKIFPQADIPVVQLSLDLSQGPQWHYDMGRRLALLRDEGVMIIGSGNVVHNLRRAQFGSAVPTYDWAERFNSRVRNALLTGDIDSLIHHANFGDDAHLAVPTPEHYLPLLYVLGSQQVGDQIEILVDGVEMGSIGMMSLSVAASH